MMAETKSWKRSGGLVTALKDKEIRKAQVRLTALYIILAGIVLVFFAVAWDYTRTLILQRDLLGQLHNPALEIQLLNRISGDLQADFLVFTFFLLLVLSILGFLAIRLMLQPIKIFVEGNRRFIADASHELRTPLTTMRTEIEVALLDPESVSREEMLEILRSNTEEIDRMSGILNNLLNLASFHDVSANPPMTPVDLKNIVNLVAARSEKISAPKQVTVDTGQTQPVRVMGNVTALEEVVSNLLKNAIYYSRPGGRVEVSARPLNNRYAELRVQDNGVGIPADELPHIFEPFYRSGRSFHMHKSGAGLGLAIVREMVKRHQGSIRIASAPDQGTTVTVRLPRASQAKGGEDMAAE